VALLSKKIGFIGAGNMGEAIVGAVIRSDIFDASMIAASDVSQERLKVLAESYGIKTMADNMSLFNQCDIVILSIKPHHIGPVLSEIASQPGYRISTRKLIISVAAGIPIKKIEALLYFSLDDKKKANLPIVRVMPNTPALVLKGMSGMSANLYCTPDDIRITQTILNAMGKVIEFKELDLDAVTALSGSGPAYIFYFIESMIRGGVELGLKADVARELTIETVKGAVKLLEDLGEAPGVLRQKVTSPGGTTEAALSVFEANGVKQSIVEGLIAAAKRSVELSRS